MKIYRIWPEERYRWVKNDVVGLQFGVDKPVGVARAGEWTPLAVHTEAPVGDEHADLPFFVSGAIVLTDRAMSVLGDRLAPSGEFLALDCAEERLTMFVPLVVLDAFDEEASEVERHASGGINAVWEYVFRPETVGDAEIFRVPHPGPPWLFLTEPLAAAIRESGLRGTRLAEVWPR